MDKVVSKTLNFLEKFQLPLLLLVAIILRIQQMGREFFYDELNTVYNFIQSPNLIDAIHNPLFTSQLAYPILGYGACHLLGVSEWSLRLPALLFGLGSIVLLWFFCKKYFSPMTAFLSSSFLICSPVHIIWSTSARGYSAMIFLAIASTYLYFSLLEKPSFKKALTLILINVLGFFFHLFFIGVICLQVLHFLWVTFHQRNDPSIKNKFIIGISATGGSLLFSWLTHGISGWINISQVSQDLPPLYGESLIYFPLKLWSEYLALDLWPYGVIAAFLMLLGLIPNDKKRPFWLSYIFILFLCSIIMWLQKPGFIYPRYFACLFPFIFLSLANGMIYLSNILPIKIRPFLITSYIFFLILIGWNWATKPSELMVDFQDNYKTAVRYAESISNEHTAFCAFGNQDIFYQYYSKRPVIRFRTFNEFMAFYQRESSIICFAMMGPPMSPEHKKIFYTMYINKVDGVSFKNILVFHLKN